MVRFQLFSLAFEIAIKDNLLSNKDFISRSENELMKIIEESSNPEIQILLKMLLDGDLKRPEKDLVRVVKKFRYIDPFIITTNGLRKLSELKPEFAKIIQIEKEKCAQGFLV